MGAQAFVPRSVASDDPSPGSPSRGVEVAALLLVALGVFLTLSLASLRFDPMDHSSTGASWMGAVGATLASLFVSAFGLGAWLLPLECFLLGRPLFRGRRPSAFSLHLSGDLLILVLASALLQVLMPGARFFGGALPGGNVGLFFGEVLRGLFSTPGSLLVGLTVIALILVGRASFSFLKFCERAAAVSRELWTLARALLLRMVKRAQEARELRREQDALVASESAGQFFSETLAFAGGRAEPSWVPEVLTGRPPLCIVESLRRSPVDSVFNDTGLSPIASAPATHGEQDSEADGLFGMLLADDAASPVSRTAGRSAAGPSIDSAFATDGGWSFSSFDSELSDVDGLPDPEPVGSQLDEGELSSEGSPSLPDNSDPGEEPRIVDTAPAQAIFRANSRRQTAASGYQLPPTDLLGNAENQERAVSRDGLLRHATQLEKTLLDYGVVGQVDEIHPGPTVTTFEFSPASGTKVSKVASLADDLALGLSRKVRIIAPIPGKNRIGFEIPNDDRQAVNLRELIEDERFQNLGKRVPLPVVLGRDIVGAPFYADLSSMPHVIVAGATGAGKSVGLNVMLSSLLFSRSPEELRLLMIDPKVVELAPFDRIPHLLLPVVTDMKQAAKALAWAVDEMERRYQLFADAGTKNIATYNRYAERIHSGDLPAPRPKTSLAIGPSGEVVELDGAKSGGDGVTLPEKIPFIVIVIDEFADLMMQQGKEVEASVARLAQKARAAGMHVILATQRPSVDVITGMIKANFPSRIAFRVAQKVDSRTILDEQGAEVLLGRGDMLVKLNGATDTMRVQCPFVSEEEVSDLTDFVRRQGEPRYEEAILAESGPEPSDEVEEKLDSRFEEAVLIVRETQRCSTSWLQRKMTIGYNRAAKIVELMEKRGYVGAPNGSKDREVLLPPG